MKFLEEFRKSDYAGVLAEKIKNISKRPVRLMEFCGGHTASLLKYGINDLLPRTVEMLAGPGCPVCVTSRAEIDRALEISRKPGVVLCSFGDMLRVKGTRRSLSQQKSLGADIRVVYSPDDAVKMAVENPKNRVVFFGGRF